MNFIKIGRIKVWLIAVSLLFAFLTRVLAQSTANVEVIHNVNLRSDPSTTNDPIVLLHPSAKLILLSSERVGGYYHIRTQDGKEGWVWARNVSPVETTSTASTAAEPSSTISPVWAKPEASESTFQGLEGPCPFNGNGSDPDQFALKNRSDTPSSYNVVTWSAINDLPFPGRTDGRYAKPHRKDWKQSELNVIRPFEGIPVTVIGYVVAIKPQSGGSGEGTNCNFNQTGDVDTHIALVGEAGDPEKNSIVIE